MHSAHYLNFKTIHCAHTFVILILWRHFAKFRCCEKSIHVFLITLGFHSGSTEFQTIGWFITKNHGLESVRNLTTICYGKWINTLYIRPTTCHSLCRYDISFQTDERIWNKGHILIRNVTHILPLYSELLGIYHECRKVHYIEKVPYCPFWN